MSKTRVLVGIAVVLSVGLVAGAQSSERGIDPPVAQELMASNYYQMLGIDPPAGESPLPNSPVPLKAYEGTNTFFGIYVDADLSPKGAEYCFTVPQVSGTPPTGWFYLFDNVTNTLGSGFDGIVDLGYACFDPNNPQPDPLDLLTTDTIEISFNYQTALLKGATFDSVVMKCDTRCCDDTDTNPASPTSCANPTARWEPCATTDYFPVTIPRILDSNSNLSYVIATSYHSWQHFNIDCEPIAPDAVPPTGQPCPAGYLVQTRIGLGTVTGTTAQACYNTATISY